MDLLTTLVLGAYAYTTLVGAYILRRVDGILENHLKHLRREVDQLKLTMPPDS